MGNDSILDNKLKFFNRFLVEEGCFFNFYNILLKKYASKAVIICEFKKTYSKDWISAFFMWNQTKEGIKYWSDISRKWEKRLMTLVYPYLT